MSIESAPADVEFHFEHRYAQLAPQLGQRIRPTPVAAPQLLAWNDALAAELGVTLSPGRATAILSGNEVPANALPFAMAYAGHQFGHFVPQLGDGRAILLGELIDRHGQRRDLQLKGAGPTAYSRNGDGRAAIGPVLREFLISESMHALGIPTTRALAAVATGERVFRDGPVPGAVLARVAASHVRVGTFQYFAARADLDTLRLLVGHALQRHYPERADEERPALALLDAVAARQAALVARWMHVGFIHGVMNTDNITISGETIDYGPCAFLDEYEPDKVFSSIDRGGRYAYANQAPILHWNLARLAECLLPLIDSDAAAAVAAATEVLDSFPALFGQHWLDGMRAKLGLATAQPGDETLVQDFLAALEAAAADYTLSFRALCDAADVDGRPPDPRCTLPSSDQMHAWLARWRVRLAQEPQARAVRAAGMRAINPAVIARNHRVHAALVAAEGGDLAPFHALLAAIRQPFEDGDQATYFMLPPQPAERVLHTFCGT